VARSPDGVVPFAAIEHDGTPDVWVLRAEE